MNIRFTSLCFVVGILFSTGLYMTTVKAESAYKPGLQHLYPYYIPLNNNLFTPQTGTLDNSFSANPDEAPEDVTMRFAQERLKFNQLGSIAFSTVIYHISQSDSLMQKQGRCGLVGWECSGERWQRLINFSQTFGLDYQDQVSQLFFINFEFNELTDGYADAGSYLDVYWRLKMADDLQSAISVMLSRYVNQVANKDLSDVASKIYNYSPVKKYNDPVEVPEPILIKPTPEPEPVKQPENKTKPEVKKPQPEPKPEAKKPQSEPEVKKPIFRTNTFDCSAGLKNGYISHTKAKDDQGFFLVPIKVLSPYSTGKTVVQYVHRCLKTNIEKLLNDFNKDQTPENKLGGFIWRTNDRQIHLRKKYCGQSHYDIYQKRPSECNPPVARPGRSAHQDGQAIDFYCTSGGSINRTNCNKAFEWLNCNAAEYGLVKIPLEDWHWEFPLNHPEKLNKKLLQVC